MHILRMLIVIYISLGSIVIGASEEDSFVEEKVAKSNAYAKEGDYSQALEAINDALSKEQQNPRLYKIRGHIYYAMEQYQPALNDLSRVIDLVPNSANAYADRAIVYSVSGQHSQAVADIEKAMEINPDSVFVLWVRKEIMEREKK